MSYFPMFVNLERKRIFVAGGGKVALRKCRVLVLFGCEIHVFAKKVKAEFSQLPVTIHQGSLTEHQLKKVLGSYDYVLAATNERKLNHRIAMLSKSLSIPVNVADSKEESSFFFPAIVKREDLVIGISSGGLSPAFTSWVRQYLQGCLPEDFGDLVRSIGRLEGQMKEKAEGMIAAYENNSGWNEKK